MTKAILHFLLFGLLLTLAPNAMAIGGHLLTDNEVVVTEGVIMSCSYDFSITDIIIPETLHGQSVTGITDGASSATGVFYRKGITSVQLPTSLTYIGDYAFTSNSISSLSIPASVTKIGRIAFGYAGISTLTFAEGLTTMGDYAFTYNNLTSVVLPESLTIIPGGAFDRSRSLASVQLGSAVTSIGNVAFNECAIASLTLPESLTSIGEKAFYKNTELTTLSLPSHLDSIGEKAFSVCGLTNLSIPASVTNIGEAAFSYNDIASLTFAEGLLTMGEYVFGRNELTSVILPNSLTSIPTSCFYSNTTLANVTFGDAVTEIGQAAFGSCNITAVDFPSTLVSIGNSSFAYNSNLTSITIPSNVTEIGIGAFYGCGLTTLLIPENVLTIGNSAFKGNQLISVELPNSITIIENDLFSNNPLLKSLVLGNQVVSIEQKAFSNCKLSTIDLPATLTVIGNNAFENNALTTVEIPSMIRYIGSNAFVGNSGLASITLPQPSLENTEYLNWIDSEGSTYTSNAQVSDFTYSYMAILAYTLTDEDVVVENGIIQSASFDEIYQAIVIPSELDGQSVIGIADGTYEIVFGGKSIFYLALPSTLEGIGDYAFYGNDLIELTLPDGIIAIGEYAFKNCDLISLNLPSSLSTLGRYAFVNNKLTEVNIPETLTTIGESAFQDNEITAISLPANMLIIPEGLFAGNALSSVTIPEGVKIIGDEAFDGNQISSLVIPASVEIIDNEAFYENAIETLTLSEGLHSIGESAFEENSLTEVTLPSTVVYIDEYGFDDNDIDELLLPIAVKPGYTFIDWSYDGDDGYAGGEIIDEVEYYFEANFTKSAYEISGTVDGTDDIILTLSGDVNQTLFLESGDDYTFGVNAGDSVVVSAYKYAYEIDTVYTFIDVQEDKDGIDFDASIMTYTLSGTLTGADDVTISLLGDNPSSQTVSKGESYSFTVENGENVSIVATKDGYSFAPGYYSFYAVDEGLENNDFVATLITYDALFNVSDGNSPISGANVNINSTIYTTDSEGKVSIEGLVPGDYPYTVSASPYENVLDTITVVDTLITELVTLGFATDINTSNAANVEIYPNPFVGYINFVSKESVNKIELFSTNGKLVISDKLNSNSIYVGQLNTGIYIMRVYIGNEIITKRIIKN